MIRGLKVALIVWAVTGILLGLGYILIPRELGDMFGYAEGPAYVPYFLATLGVSYIVFGVFLITAARDPLQNILWVKYAIALAILLVVVDVYSILRGFVTFSQAGGGIIVDGIFAIAFLALYPWRAIKEASQ